ncbi:MAG TPA: saccharopine dehydrogenase NADP-binding domain-containing protein [Solirubrobacterales bacterium]|nr:saccharopine dehydrogenase NADP-binding domain-containing protein [Solirubrobacterales bacterium]
MPLLSRQRGSIAVYGATGYTGRLVAAELKAAGADFVLSGRSREKLDALAGQLGGGVRVQQASLGDEASLRSLLADCAAVIDCAGPFTLHGEPVLRAAVDTSTHYLDTTGEQPYMRLAFEKYGPRAEANGTVVIPAMGFDYLPGDMIASLAAEGMGEVDDVVIAYAVAGMRATRGTMLSALEMLKGGDVEWRKLQWMPASQSVGRGSFDFGEPIGRQRMGRYPAGEQITVPRHVATRRVQTMITISTFAPGPLGALFAPLTRPAQVALRTPLRKAVGTVISRLPEGPSESDRAAARFTVVCDVVKGHKARRGVIRGSDVYGLTAASIVRGAIIAAQGGIPRSGALAPSQAFPPKNFLRALRRFDVDWEVDETRETVPAEA